MKGIGFLARRFLFSKHSDGFLSIVAGASVIGVSLGVAALVVVLSVVNGFEGELARAITGMNGDVIFYTRGNPVEPERVSSKIRALLGGESKSTPSFVTEIMVAGESAVAGAILEGVDSGTLDRVSTVRERVMQGSFPAAEGEVLLGADLARKIGATPGSKVHLIAPFAGKEATPVSREFTVSGLFSMGMYQYDSKFVLALLPAVQGFLNQPGFATTWKLKLPRGMDPFGAARKLGEEFGAPYRAKAWPELNKNLFYAIRLERAVIAILLTSIVAVAALNVVSTLMVLIHDRRREILILKAMGLRPRQGFGLFGKIGLLIGLVGAGCGVAGGMGLAWLIAHTRWFEIPADVYMIGFLPVRVRPTEALYVGSAALLLCLLAACYPSWRATRMSPAEGMKDG